MSEQHEGLSRAKQAEIRLLEAGQKLLRARGAARNEAAMEYAEAQAEFDATQNARLMEHVADAFKADAARDRETLAEE